MLSGTSNHDSNQKDIERGSPTQVWGAKAIGRVINRTERQTNHLLRNGAIKSARKVLGMWTANADKLVREFAGE